jgi:hypothetical protein
MATYVILNKSEIVDSDGNEIIDFSQLLNRNANMLRYSIDKSQALVKYEGNKPRCLYGKTTYTHSQIKTEMAKEAWTTIIEE